MNHTTLPPQIVWLPIGQLTVDPDINRPLTRERVTKIAADLDPNAIGVLTVSARPDGTYVLLDGQHRQAALRAAGWLSSQPVPCDVRHGLTRAQEASLFVKLNNTAKPLAVHRFLRRITANEPVATCIAKIAAEVGFTVSAHHGDGLIKAVAALERVYLGIGEARKRGPFPDVLRATLQVLSQAYGHTADAVNGHLIGGVGLFLLRYGDAVDHTVLIDKLRGVHGGALGLLAKARGLPFGSIEDRVAQSCVASYNHGRRAHNRLAGWSS
jgi:hypothetical protein